VLNSIRADTVTIISWYREQYRLSQWYRNGSEPCYEVHIRSQEAREC